MDMLVDMDAITSSDGIHIHKYIHTPIPYTISFFNFSRS
jgi:hypothetical protein